MKSTIFQIYIYRTSALRTAVFGVLAAVALAGCGGTKVLKESQPIESTQPLAAVSDQHVTATLDWVIVRDGPGTWARNANWDEYLLRVSNQSDQLIQVTKLIVVDSLNTRIESQPRRKQLVKGSKKTARRYKESGMKVKAGSGRGTMGVAVATAGGAAAGAAMGAGTLAGAGGGAAVVGGVVLAPVLVVGGIVRGVNQRAVNTQIEQRQTLLPLDVPARNELMLDVFFPLAPSPRTVELAYSDATGEHVIAIDTSAALNGLHIESSVE
ncbi:MAG: hypothetical protein ACE5OQ_11690 [Woeseia sp.]